MAAAKRPDTGWSSGRRLIAILIGVVAVLALFTPFAPVWLSVWLIAVVVVYLWPDHNSGRYQPLTGASTRASSVRLMRRYLWRWFTKHPWRIGPEGDNDGDYGHNEPHTEQTAKKFTRPKLRLKRKPQHQDPDVPQQQTTEEPKSPRIVALNAIAALLVAVASVGAERLLAISVPQVTGMLHTATGERFLPLGWFVDIGRPWWLQVLAAPMGWSAAKAFAAWRRMHASAKLSIREDMVVNKPSTCAPTALWSNPYIAPATPGPFAHIKKVSSAIEVAFAVGAAVALVVLALPLGLDISLSIGLAAVPLAVLVSGMHAMRPWVKEQAQPWEEWQSEIRSWEDNWSKVMPPNRPKPQLVSYMKYPDEPENEDWPPMVKQLVFAMPTGTDYEHVKKSTDQLKPALQCDLVHLAPGVVKGTREATWSYISIHHELPEYSIWVEQRKTTWRDWSYRWKIEIDRQVAYHDPTIHEGVRTFLFNRQLGRAMSELNIGVLLTTQPPRMRSVGDGSPAYIRFAIPLHGKATFANLKKNLDKLAEKMRAKWLRFELLGADNVAIGHMCAIHPGDAKFPRTFEREARKEITQLDWQWYMGTAKLFGSDGTTTPMLLTAAKTNERKGDPEATIHKIKFSLPAGLTKQRIADNVAKLSVASNYPFVSVENEELPSEITVLAGHRDPLDDTYLFNDHADTKMPHGYRMLDEPVLGEPRTGWCVGVGVDGSPMWMEWDHEEPHLLIAGASGSGKSMVINSMMVQLLTNNDPSDLEIWLMEPKNELGRYAHKEHVRVFVDLHVAEGSIYHVAAQTFQALVDEMERRYALMNDHPMQPQKLTEARLIAKNDPKSAYMAFRPIIVIVEECTSFFGKPATAEHKDDFNLMMVQVGEIARKARAAGIHMVFATQNPTKDAIPTQIKRNCRRVGLRTSDKMGSMVIIDTPGLDEIQKPGRGLMTGKHGYTGYRAFLLQAPDADEPHITNELGEHLKGIRDNSRWPKIPPGVEPAVDKELLYEPVIE